MIDIRGLRLSFGEKVIFGGVNCRIGEDARIGVVGRNGAGKTTLLRVLMGEVEPDDGRVERSRGLTVGYLPQDLVELEPVPLLDLLQARSGAEAWLCRKVLNGLGFHRGDEGKSCGDFSGGWKMRIVMAALLLSEPDVLLLDEPTNHLDTESMEWLEGWLRGRRGAMVAVSHDRRFLENMTTQIAELERGALTLYPWGYERYLVEKRLSRERLQRSAEEQRREIERIESFVSRFRYKATKAAQVQSRLKRLERMEIIQTEGPEKEVNFRIPEAPASGWEVLRATELSKRYGELDVFGGLTFSLNRGERTALVGVNGAGKSTLLRLLSGTEAPTSGSVKLGHNVRAAFYSQESARNLDYSRTVWEEARGVPSKLNDVERRGLLGAFLFPGEDIHKAVSVLSGGEKARLALYKLMLEETNFLILDEPTNHLDPDTREVVQRALLQYQGTLLIVSHDRHFLDALADRVLELREGRLYDYPGNYSWFLEKREETLGREAPTGGNPSEGAARSREARRQAAQERERTQGEIRGLKRDLAALEKRIAEAEARQAEIDGALCDPVVLADSGRVREFMVERSAVSKELQTAYEAWENLSLRLEALRP